MGFWVPLGMMAASAISGAISGRKKNNEVTTKIDRTTTPVYDARSQEFRDFLINSFMNNLQGSEDFDNSYRAAGLGNLARSNQNVFSGVEALLASRGIGRTTAGANALASTLSGFGRNTSDFLNKSVLDLDQRRQGLLGQAGSFFSSLPTATRTTGTDIQTQPTQGSWGGLISGATQGLGAWLGAKYANDSFANLLKNLPQYKSGN